MSNPNSNPYQLPPGPDLDRLIHEQIFGVKDSTSVPTYSTSESAATELRRQLAGLWGFPIKVGRSRVRQKPWFARCETGPSTSTEVLAETWPLAVARLAAIYLVKE